MQTAAPSRNGELQATGRHSWCTGPPYDHSPAECQATWSLGDAAPAGMHHDPAREYIEEVRPFSPVVPPPTMSSTPSSRTTDSVPESPPLRTLMASRLPIELMHHVLRHLQLRDLRIVALASRAFNAYALQAGLCIDFDLLWNPFYFNDSYARSFDKLDCVLAHAVTRPGLNITLRAALRQWADETDEDCQWDMRQLVRAILRALPYLVRLEFSFSHLAFDAAFCALQAPKLRALSVTQRTDTPVIIAHNLFNGDAPKLREVTLVLKDTDSMGTWEPIAVFRNVTQLKLSAKSIPQRLSLARLFHALRVLTIDARDAPETHTIDLDGLALRHLALAGDIKLLADASLDVPRSIRVFEHRTGEVAAELMCPAPCDALCAVAEHCGRDASVSFGPRDGAWRRTIVSPYLRAGALPLADIPRLGSLTAGESLVTALVQTPIALGALRELFIDVTTAQDPFDLLDHASATSLSCPALARVVLFARAPEHPVTLTRQRLARLGRALGLRERRPALVLVRCGWELCDRYTVPDKTDLAPWFSNVDDANSVGACIPDYYDACRCSGYFGTEDGTV